MIFKEYWFCRYIIILSLLICLKIEIHLKTFNFNRVHIKKKEYVLKKSFLIRNNIFINKIPQI